MKFTKFPARMLLLVLLFVLSACQNQAQALTVETVATQHPSATSTISQATAYPKPSQVATQTQTQSPTDAVVTLETAEATFTAAPSATLDAPYIDELLLRVVDMGHPIDTAYLKLHIEPSLVNFHGRWSQNHQGVKINHTNVLVNKLCVDDLIALLEDADRSGLDLYIRSIYRSLDSQQIALDNVKGDKSLVLPPGTSQHHTGLAVDFTYGSSSREVGANFSNTPESAWLQQNAIRYGFVMSYVAGHDKVSYETWHYYYIGKDLSPIYEKLLNQGTIKDVFEFQELMNNYSNPAP